MKKVRTRPDTLNRWRMIKALIIDEVSMVDPAFFEALDIIGRRVRSSPQVVFGGIQLIMAGDFLQLPYVRKGQDDYPFLFETKTWSLLFGVLDQEATAPPDYDSTRIDRAVKTLKTPVGVMVHLTQIYRQREADFVALLQAVRMAEQTPEQVAVLQSRVGAVLDVSDGIRPTRLYPHRADVERENLVELNQLPFGGEFYQYMAQSKGEERYVDMLEKNCQAPKVLTLKLGAQVVLLRNLDFKRQLGKPFSPPPAVSAKKLNQKFGLARPAH